MLYDEIYLGNSNFYIGEDFLLNKISMQIQNLYFEFEKNSCLSATYPCQSLLIATKQWRHGYYVIKVMQIKCAC